MCVLTEKKVYMPFHSAHVYNIFHYNVCHYVVIMTMYITVGPCL